MTNQTPNTPQDYINKINELRDKNKTLTEQNNKLIAEVKEKSQCQVEKEILDDDKLHLTNEVSALDQKNKELTQKNDKCQMEKGYLQGSLLQLQSDYKNSISLSVIEVASCQRNLENCSYQTEDIVRNHKKELEEQYKIRDNLKESLESEITRLMNSSNEFQRENRKLTQEKDQCQLDKEEIATQLRAFQTMPLDDEIGYNTSEYLLTV